jgi:large subunit ribosomal protein L23
MNKEYLTTVLVGPVVSEKSTLVGDASNQVVFKVRPDARKLEIKHAVEQMFAVKVVSVNVLNVKGKRKGNARSPGKRPDWKKAYVTLQQGHDIDFMGAE